MTGAIRAGPVPVRRSASAAWPNSWAHEDSSGPYCWNGRRAALARSMPSGSGVNVPDIAYMLLTPDDGRRLAEPYYRRLDRAAQAATKSEEGTA